VTGPVVACAFDQRHSGSLLVPDLGVLTVEADREQVWSVTLGQPGQAMQAADAITEPYLTDLRAYFAGQLRHFDWPLFLDPLPPFRRRVLEALRTVAYGETITYGQLAALSGNSRAAHAVGQAVARNPFGIVIPCHRVVARDGLGGYGGCLSAKIFLLELERTHSHGGDR
jgi:methylated-DNA-[protein]-cysteine S-methyltransferase